MDVLRKRQRFTDNDDLSLLREVLAQNPFENPARWEVIREHVLSVTGKTFSIRTLKEHLERLVKMWLEQYNILKDKNLAFGVGIQNFPEGLAVSLPLQAAGYSTFKAFWYGQLSGMVEPIFGVLGAYAVGLATPVLPYALSFAAGAMVYVVVDDIIPEANTNGNGKLASWTSIVGFLLMMALDVGLTES